MKTLADLAAMTREPVTIQFDYNGEPQEMRIRRLTADLWAQYEALGPGAILPPERKPEMDGRGKPKPIPENDRLDWNDEGYKAKCEEAQRAQIAFLLDNGLEGGVPGDGMAEKVKYLNSTFPVNLIVLLVREISKLSGGVIETANFTTAAPSGE